MSILDRFLGRSTPPPSNETKGEAVSIENFRSINTEGLDLSQPFVDDYNNRGLQFVMFGDGNMYPQILNQLYISSPMHQACCNFKKYSLIGNGYEWENYDNLSVGEKIAIKQFETMSRLKYASRQIALDFIKHGRAIVLLHFDERFKKYTHFKVVDPEKIRNSRVSLFKETPDFYYYSADWATSYSQMRFTPYRDGNTDKWQIAEIRNDVGGFESYGFPDWASSANWQKVGADIALLHKSAIENGIQPSVIFKYPYIMSPAEEETWKRGMQDAAKGAKNYGRAMKVQSNSREQMPEIDVVSTTDNHALFEQTSKEYKEEVAISHGIDPALMGVRVAGSLGAQDEKEFSAEQFKKVWVNDNREIIEEFLNALAKICGVNANLLVKETDILTIKELMESNGEPLVNDKEADARAQLRGSVGGVQGIIQIQESVAAGLSDRGSAIALLELIYGFSTSDATRLLGDVQEGSAPNAARPEQMANMGNDALRGLTAKENMDMIRIVRDFGKGKLAEPLARTRLAAYGIDSETITNLLTE
jgi:hypothetical protein